MSAWRAWLRAARPLAHANIAPPLVLGQALAFAATGRFSLRAAALVHALGVLDHLVIVLVNDLDDEESDRLHDAPTPFSGGSRVLVDGSLSRAALRRAAAAAVAAFGALAVLAAAVLDAWALVVSALAALGLVWAYSGQPVRASHRGGGALLQGLGLGVVLPLLGAAAQGSPRLPVSWLAAPFLLGVVGHWVTAVPDEHADRRAGKRTLAAVRGGRVARRAALMLVVVAALLGATLLPGPGVARGAALAAVLAAAVPAWALGRDAGPESRRRCLLWVVAMGAAILAAQLGWTLAAVLA